METRVETEELKIPDVLPLLPVRDVVVYPYMILPLFVGREISINAVDEALSKDRLIFLATQRDVSDEEPSPDEIYGVGTVAMIMRMLKLPDGRVKILVQGLTKGRITEFVATKPFYAVSIERIVEPAVESDLETEALMRTVKEQLGRIVGAHGHTHPDPRRSAPTSADSHAVLAADLELHGQSGRSGSGSVCDTAVEYSLCFTRRDSTVWRGWCGLQ